ncbi:hypothetical protein BOTBODRAFT_476857 [Botryobasidium botryosum FD-172 SS1]|uniref:H-type lectin domain-containing protein n=1 Tax=Botryobasidium botryosum (strain FD-172 SS1) TaxID=930990 RepID=A0A067MTC4_BOTB1|nr:hypothetical protein BOTBODRAFT_476857 [Botryobasidium botryosum FD-172 SS1]
MSIGTFNFRGDEPRNKTTSEIIFAKPFVAPPRLPLGLNFIDVDPKSTNPRVTTYATNIDKNRFLVHIDGWGDTNILGCGVSWLGLSPGHLEFQYGEFCTLEDHRANEPQRETSRRIVFERPFATPPKVIVFLKKFDMTDPKNGTTWRIHTDATNIDHAGFTIHVDTWCDTVLHCATAGWIAYPEDREYVFSGRSEVNEAQPRTNRSLQNNKEVKFGSTVGFLKAPSVFVAISSFDLSCLRLKVYVDSVTTTGLTWHMDSWGEDTWFHGGAISYICLM